VAEMYALDGVPEEACESDEGVRSTERTRQASGQWLFRGRNEPAIERHCREARAARQLRFRPSPHRARQRRNQPARQLYNSVVRRDGAKLSRVVARIGSHAQQHHQPGEFLWVDASNRNPRNFSGTRGYLQPTVGELERPAVREKKLFQCSDRQNQDECGYHRMRLVSFKARSHLPHSFFVTLVAVLAAMRRHR